jgi:hypothetical protein
MKKNAKCVASSSHSPQISLFGLVDLARSGLLAQHCLQTLSANRIIIYEKAKNTSFHKHVKPNRKTARIQQTNKMKEKCIQNKVEKLTVIAIISFSQF